MTKPDVNALAIALGEVELTAEVLPGIYAKLKEYVEVERFIPILTAALSEREGDCPKPHVPVYLQSDKYAVRCVQCHAELPVVKQPIAGDPEWKPIPAEARMACGHLPGDWEAKEPDEDTPPLSVGYCRTCKQQAEAVAQAIEQCAIEAGERSPEGVSSHTMLGDMWDERIRAVKEAGR